MPKKEYFYIENGKTKQFIYCTLCGDGPFKQNDFKQIIYKCGDKQKMYYCKKCNLQHHTKDAV